MSYNRLEAMLREGFTAVELVMLPMIGVVLVAASQPNRLTLCILADVVARLRMRRARGLSAGELQQA